MGRKRAKAGKPPNPSQPAAAEKIPWHLVAVALALAVLVLSVYWQTGGHQFINLDDDLYVYENPVVLRGLTLEGVRWATTTFHAANWHPLTWLSHMLDVELFGPSPGWHHRMNALYHLLNTELLFFVLWRMTGGMWPSAFVAALFGVHPLHVESVAWVSERKDVLSTLFWILTMGAYLRYARKPAVARYLPVAACFAVGLLCKPMLVTLPLVLLLLDFWPLGRMAPVDPPDTASWRGYLPSFSRFAREKVPLLLLSAASCAVTYLAQAGGGAVKQWEHVPLGARISNAVVAYVSYLGKTVWPSSLAVLYPHPAFVRSGYPAWQVAGSALLLGGLTYFAVWQWKRRPYLAVGWLWYLGTLVPVIGVVQVGAQAMADRYTYVPLIGVFIAVAWGVPEALNRWRFRRHVLAGIGGGIILALGISAWVQVGYWRDNFTLFARTLRFTENNWMIGTNLGVAYAGIGQYQQAIGYYREALRIKPDYAMGWFNMGCACEKLGQYREAIGYYREALRIKPDYAAAWYNLGQSHEKLGQYQEAIACYREAVRFKPDYPEAWNNMGVSFGSLRRYRESIDPFREAVRIRPDYGMAWFNLGGAYAALGEREKVREVYGQLLQADPARAKKFLVMLGPERERFGL